MNQYHRIDNPLPVRTALSILRADENIVAIRKQNIRRFGAGWLRPLGVGKTLQGMADENAEKEEQELVAQRWGSLTFLKHQFQDLRTGAETAMGE